MKLFKSIISVLTMLSPAFSLADYHPPIEYGVAKTIDFVLYNTDGTLDVDEADGGAEVTVHCDGDAGTTATNDFVDEGSYYSIALTAGELQCERTTLDIAATDRNVVIIPTFGHASAQVNDEVILADNAITAAKIAADAIGASEAGFLSDSTGFAGADIAAIRTDTETTLNDLVDDLESRLGTPSDFGSGTSTIAANLEDLADDGTTAYDRATDSQQELRDRGDVGWITGGGTGLTAIASGTAQAATATTLQLASGETFADSELVGAIVQITGGTTGVGQTSCISANTGSTDTVTVDTWVTTPTGTITYEIAPSLGNDCAVDEGTLVDSFRTEPCGSETADTLGDLICNDLEGIALGTIVVSANVTQISGDSTAADNLESYSDGTTPQPVNATQISGDGPAADNAEAFFDGTGYAGTNNVIPLVTAITDTVDADVVSVSGDAGAADSLELQYDASGLTGDTFPAAQLALATAQTGLDLLNSTFLNCEVNTANFAGSTTTFACILTDLADVAVVQANNDLEGLQVVVTSGNEIREARFINDTTWDGANLELQVTISRALPATLADAVTAIIR